MKKYMEKDDFFEWWLEEQIKQYDKDAEEFNQEIKQQNAVSTQRKKDCFDDMKIWENGNFLMHILTAFYICH